MTVFSKTEKSDPTTDDDLKIEYVTETISSGSVEVTFDADFSSKPVVHATGIEEGTVVNAEIDNGSTYDSDKVTIVGDEDVDVCVIAIGK